MTQSPYSGTQLHCYRHKDRATYVRCQRCGRPICPECMISAAVGFQCPHCVKQGAKASRQNRAPFGGRISASAPATTVVLISVNVAVWLAIMITGGYSS
ncbi:MAG: hypothetical protein LBU38_06225, partial [Propionibacteriaceae bacterium]|nr:hypothetical protein [Propionibacteriaceae bacterium]